MTNQQLALVKKDVVDVVAAKVRQFQENNELHLPEDYSYGNAMKFAWLALQQTQTKDKKPVLTACTSNSIANALLNMVVQGLNPGKDQVYFIAYGRTLVCQRSYFGTMAVCKQLAGATDIHAEVVYKGDEFEYSIERANKRIVNHIQKLENINPKNIIAAYCIVEREGHDPVTEIMTMAQIETAWSMSKVNPAKEGGTHQIFKEEMCKKTVINRTCKPLINASSDGGLVLEAFKENDEIVDEAAFDAEVEEEANQGEVIDINTARDEDEVVDTRTPEEIEAQSVGPDF